MGVISTINLSGYMISVALAGIIARAIGARWTIFTGLVLVGLSMMLISLAEGFFAMSLKKKDFFRSGNQG